MSLGGSNASHSALSTRLRLLFVVESLIGGVLSIFDWCVEHRDPLKDGRSLLAWVTLLVFNSTCSTLAAWLSKLRRLFNIDVSIRALRVNHKHSSSSRRSWLGPRSLILFLLFLHRDCHLGILLVFGCLSLDALALIDGDVVKLWHLDFGQVDVGVCHTYLPSSDGLWYI